MRGPLGHISRAKAEKTHIYTLIYQTLPPPDASNAPKSCLRFCGILENSASEMRRAELVRRNKAFDM